MLTDLPCHFLCIALRSAMWCCILLDAVRAAQPGYAILQQGGILYCNAVVLCFWHQSSDAMLSRSIAAAWILACQDMDWLDNHFSHPHALLIKRHHVRGGKHAQADPENPRHLCSVCIMLFIIATATADAACDTRNAKLSCPGSQLDILLIQKAASCKGSDSAC